MLTQALLESIVRHSQHFPSSVPSSRNSNNLQLAISSPEPFPPGLPLHAGGVSTDQLLLHPSSSFGHEYHQLSDASTNDVAAAELAVLRPNGSSASTAGSASYSQLSLGSVNLDMAHDDSTPAAATAAVRRTSSRSVDTQTTVQDSDDWSRLSSSTGTPLSVDRDVLLTPTGQFETLRQPYRLNQMSDNVSLATGSTVSERPSSSSRNSSLTDRTESSYSNYFSKCRHIFKRELCVLFYGYDLCINH